MILCHGEMLIDFIPTEARDGTLAYRPAVGGSPGNVALTLARLDVPSGFVGGLSTDFFGEQIASVFFPDVIRYLPFSVANAATRLTSGSNQGLRNPLDHNVALLWVVGWLAAALIFAAIYTERAEITG